MKNQRYRFKLLALLLSFALGCLALFGFLNLRRFEDQWQASPLNTRSPVSATGYTEGNLYDRNKYLLGETIANERIRPQDEIIRRATAHVIGDPDGKIPNGIEQLQADHLFGVNAALPEKISSLIAGEKPVGNHLTLTLDSQLSATSYRAFTTRAPGKNGAIIIVDYTTGEIPVSASFPSFDPNTLSTDILADSTLLNRVTQKTYPLGSLADLLSAITMPDGDLSPASIFSDISYEDLGFNTVFPWSEIHAVESIARQDVAPRATPLHIALLASAVANNGSIQEPRLIRQIETPSGRILQNLEPRTWLSVCSPAQAEKVLNSLPSSIQNTYGYTMMDFSGLRVKLKSCTVLDENSATPVTYAWFAGFSTDPRRPYTVCVLTETQSHDPEAALEPAAIAYELFSVLPFQQ